MIRVDVRRRTGPDVHRATCSTSSTATTPRRRSSCSASRPSTTRRLIERIRQAGHALGNHSWDHQLAGPRQPAGSARPALAEGADTRGRPCDRVGDRAVPAAVRSPRPRRPARRVALRPRRHRVERRRHGTTGPTARRTSRTECSRAIEPGAIVLLHDRLADAYRPEAFATRIRRSRPSTLVLRRLDGVLEAVTVPELLHSGRPHRRLSRHPPIGDADLPNVDDHGVDRRAVERPDGDRSMTRSRRSRVGPAERARTRADRAMVGGAARRSSHRVALLPARVLPAARRSHARPIQAPAGSRSACSRTPPAMDSRSCRSSGSRDGGPVPPAAP